MANRDDFIWFKQTFHREIEPALVGTPVQPRYGGGDRRAGNG